MTDHTDTPAAAAGAARNIKPDQDKLALALLANHNSSPEQRADAAAYLRKRLGFGDRRAQPAAAAREGMLPVAYMVEYQGLRYIAAGPDNAANAWIEAYVPIRDRIPLHADRSAQPAAGAAVYVGDSPGTVGVGGLIRERDAAIARAEKAEAALKLGGYEPCPGPLAWKPMVNHEMGEMWRKLIATERERDEALAALSALATQLRERNDA